MNDSIKKPAICYLIFNTKNNGGNKVIFEHVNRLIEKGYSVTILTLLGRQPLWFPLKIKIRHLLTALDFYKPDILVATFWPTAYFAYLLKAKRKFYLIQGWEENFHKNIVLKNLAKLTYKFPFQKIVTSEFLKEKVLNFTKNKPILKTSCGIDNSIFRSLKRRVKRNHQKVKILSVISSYTWQKGIDILVDIIKKLKKTHPEYEFTLISNEKKTFLPIFDNFISSAEPVNLAKFYNESDILLVTSRSEGFFLPGLEAMRCGCLVIAKNCGGILEYAENNKNAIILDRFDRLWKDNLIENLLKNKKLLRKLKNNGYKTAKKYHWEKIIINLEQIFTVY